MAKRINVILPETTLRTIDRLAKPGERSRFIDKAVQHYAATRSQEALRQQLKETAIRDRDIAEEVARDWVAVDTQAWQHLDHDEQPPRATRGGAKSTSRRSTQR